MILTHPSVAGNKLLMEVNTVTKHAVMWLQYCLDAVLKFADTTYHTELVN